MVAAFPMTGRAEFSGHSVHGKVLETGLFFFLFSATPNPEWHIPVRSPLLILGWSRLLRRLRRPHATIVFNALAGNVRSGHTPFSV